MKIVMIASESRPLCKTGGLADVIYSLSKELAVMGEEVFIILPYYRFIKQTTRPSVKKVSSFVVPMSWRSERADVYYTYDSGITFYLIDNSRYFDRDHLYGDWDDNERFAFFSLASKELLYHVSLIPDIIHVHDWHAGMIPCLFKEDIYAANYFRKTKFVFSIHNPAFQGMMAPSSLGDYYNLPDSLYENGRLRFKDQVSALKAGIEYADKITTVSPNHRQELLTREGGMGLESVLKLREYDFMGVLNGIDYQEFNPHEDSFIEFPYNGVNFLKQKQENKKKLFAQMHIQDFGQPLFSLISRLTWQKGLDIILPTLEALAQKGSNIVLLGSGEYQYEQMMEEIRKKYPNNIAIYIGYNDQLAHQIYASSDFFLMPSLFEPCGLGQMIAQRYGALPIIRRTGGLKDSVICYDGSNEETANGFGFDDFDQEAMKNTCLYAFDQWQDLPLRKQLMRNALKTDNSWSKSAKEYLAIYQSLETKK
ncbi:MAG: glycogen synthase [Erysipelotrichaceae bacterium]|nr:glycogen synthase [Erysipelotrichaceae bacterium]